MRGIQFIPGAPIMKQLGIEEPKPVPHVLRCTFCGEPVREAEATYGTQGLRTTLVMEVTNEDPLEWEERHRKTDMKAVSCPRCVLQLKPIYNCAGELVRQGIKFPEFD